MRKSVFLELVLLLLLLSACNYYDTEEIQYITASKVKSKINSENNIAGLEYNWTYNPEESILPYCNIINRTDIDYITGYGTIEVYVDGEWMMAKSLKNGHIPEIAFFIPANSTSDRITAYLGCYGNSFYPGKYRIVLKIQEDKDEFQQSKGVYYAVKEFVVE